MIRQIFLYAVTYIAMDNEARKNIYICAKDVVEVCEIMKEIKSSRIIQIQECKSKPFIK